MLFPAGVFAGVIIGFLISGLCNAAAKREDMCIEPRSVSLEMKLEEVAWTIFIPPAQRSDSGSGKLGGLCGRNLILIFASHQLDYNPSKLIQIKWFLNVCVNPHAHGFSLEP